MAGLGPALAQVLSPMGFLDQYSVYILIYNTMHKHQISYTNYRTIIGFWVLHRHLRGQGRII